MQMNVAGLRRNIKNLAHNYSDAQVKVREATSNDPWGPSATIMAEIADLTYNVVAFSEIMQMVWKRLNDHGKNWRHVYKALILLEYLIKTGSEKVAQQCIENIFAVQTLREFVYYEEGKDQGLHVREKAKQLVVLLKDDERLKNERAKALKAKERFAQHPSGFGSDGYVDGPVNAGPPGWRDEPPKNPGDVEFVRPQTAGEEELQLQLAMAMSREEAEQEEAKRRSDDVRLQLALSQSEQDFKQSPTRRQNERKPEDQNKQSHLLDLLDISLGATSLNSPTDGAAGTTDPWGTPNHLTQNPRSDPWSGATSPQSDPWQAPPRPPISVGATADSWLTQRTHSPAALGVNPLNDAWRQQNSTPTSALNGNLSNPVTTDPWLTKSTAPAGVASYPPQPAAHDPWLGARATPKNDDPWMAKTATNIPNADPWTMGSNNLESRPSPVGAITSPLSELDDFDIITNRNKAGQYTTNGANNNNSSLLDDMDPLSLKKPIKSPQSFLGENSSLVNLDNLIKPVMPVSNNATGAAYNPFSDSNLAPAAKPNLFQQQQQTVPSINQLKQQPFPVTLNQDPWAPVNSNNTTTQQLDEDVVDDDDDDDDDCFFDTTHVVISNSNSQIFGFANGLSNSNLDITSNSILDNNNLYNSTASINPNDNNIMFMNSTQCKSPSPSMELNYLMNPNYVSVNNQMNMNNNNNNNNNSNAQQNTIGLLCFDNINYLDNNNTPWMKPEVAATNPFLS